MDFTGRPMKGFVYVVPEGYESDADLARWVGRGVDFVASLPARPDDAPKKKRARAKKAVTRAKAAPGKGKRRTKPSARARRS
jgi:hypothetical protein